MTIALAFLWSGLWAKQSGCERSAVNELRCDCRGEGKWARSWRARWRAMRTRWLSSAECHLGHAMAPGVSVGVIVGRAPEKLFWLASNFVTAAVATSRSLSVCLPIPGDAEQLGGLAKTHSLTKTTRRDVITVRVRQLSRVQRQLHYSPLRMRTTVRP